MFFRQIFLATLCLLLSACSSIYDANSLAKKGEWKQIGLFDGERGLLSRSSAELSRLVKEGKAVNYAEYDAGYRQGNANFCNVNNAYNIGLSGIEYLGTCSNYADGLRFRLEWERGYQAYKTSL